MLASSMNSNNPSVPSTTKRSSEDYFTSRKSGVWIMPASLPTLSPKLRVIESPGCMLFLTYTRNGPIPFSLFLDSLVSLVEVDLSSPWELMMRSFSFLSVGVCSFESLVIFHWLFSWLEELDILLLLILGRLFLISHFVLPNRTARLSPVLQQMIVLVSLFKITETRVDPLFMESKSDWVDVSLAMWSCNLFKTFSLSSWCSNFGYYLANSVSYSLQMNWATCLPWIPCPSAHNYISYWWLQNLWVKSWLGLWNLGWDPSVDNWAEYLFILIFTFLLRVVWSSRFVGIELDSDLLILNAGMLFFFLLLMTMSLCLSLLLKFWFPILFSK